MRPRSFAHHGHRHAGAHHSHFGHEFWRVAWILVLLVLILLVFTPKAGGAQNAAANDLLAIANDHLYNLEYDAAQKYVESFLAENPNDLRALNLLPIVLVRQEMFRQGLLEASMYDDEGDVYKPEKVPMSPQFESAFKAALERAQKAAEARLSADPKDKEAMYWLGITYGTRGTYDFTLRRAYRDALGDGKQAVKLHKNLLELDPTFTDAKMIVGVNNYVIGSLPWYWKMLASLTGARGDRKRGLEQIRDVAENGNYARDDARVLLALLYSREGQREQTIRILLELTKLYPRSYLLQQELGSAYRVMERWQEAAAVYDSMLAKHAGGAPGFAAIPVSRIAYLSGVSHANKGDADVALMRYEFASQQNGKSKDVYVYRAQLAAAELNKRLKRTEIAQELYRRVATEAPNTPEGKAAKRALRD